METTRRRGGLQAAGRLGGHLSDDHAPPRRAGDARHARGRRDLGAEPLPPRRPARDPVRSRAHRAAPSSSARARREHFDLINKSTSNLRRMWVDSKDTRNDRTTPSPRRSRLCRSPPARARRRTRASPSTPPQHAALTQEWADAFTAETGIPVAIRKGTDILMANQIVQEGLNSPADVFLTENSPAMMMVEQAGLFSPVAPETLAAIPEEFRPASGMWTGIAARTTIFVYNKELLSEADLPKSMLDLAKPEWQGRWGAAPAGADFQAIVSALLQLRGPRRPRNWLAGLKRNALPYRGNFEAMRGANIGEVAGALIYNYYYFGDQAGTGESSDKLGVHYFGNDDPGALRLDLGRRRAQGVRQSRGGAGLPRLRHRTQGPGDPARRQQLRICRSAAASTPTRLPPLDTLGYPKVDPSLLNAQEVVQLMTAAGVM